MNNDNKKLNFIKANVMNISAKFQLHLPYGFRVDDFSKFFRKFSLSVAQPIKFSSLDKIDRVSRGLLQEHRNSVKLLSKYLREIAMNDKFHFSHCKLMELP